MTVKLDKLKERIAKGRAQIKEMVAQAAELRAAGKAPAKPAKGKRAPAKRRSTSRSTQQQASA